MDASNFIIHVIYIQGPVSFNKQGVQEPHMQIVYQFRNITNGESKY